MKKIIIGLIVFVVVLAFTLPLYADKPAVTEKPDGTKVDNGNDVAYFSSLYIHNGDAITGPGPWGDGPSKGQRGDYVQFLLGH